MGSLALLNLMMMIGPGIAPAIGSAIDDALGWRAIFGTLAVVGGVTAFAIWKLLPETGQPTGRLHLGTIRDDYRSLLRSPAFVGFAVGGGCATTSIYAFLAAAPLCSSSSCIPPSMRWPSTWACSWAAWPWAMRWPAS